MPNEQLPGGGLELEPARGSHLVILGETGCGKEYAAHHFHRAAARPGPFTAVNAREINASLGDVTGTAANIATGVKERAGLVELSSGGVLFFDEFAEMSAEVQAQLLRIVQSGEVRRAGAAQPTRVDVQYLCASHQSMSDRVPQTNPPPVPSALLSVPTRIWDEEDAEGEPLAFTPCP